jgi:hypothetical protein
VDACDNAEPHKKTWLTGIGWQPCQRLKVGELAPGINGACAALSSSSIDKQFFPTGHPQLDLTKHERSISSQLWGNSKCCIECNFSMGNSEDGRGKIPLWLDCDPGKNAALGDIFAKR